MAATDGLLFIDTPQYLNFYQVIKAKKLLDLLIEQQEHVLVTTQIAREVQRNKLRIAENFLHEHFTKLDLNKFNVPEHLFDMSNETAVELRKMLDPIVPQINKIEELLKNATRETLDRISRSEDKVTKDLNELFRKAVMNTEEELERARARKERGNPPGKHGDPLGDQLSWEQLLSQCKEKKKKMVWIISGDKDYYTRHDGNLFLNPVLRQELLEIAGTEAFCFDNLSKGIQDFVSKMGVKTDKLPAGDESKAIQDELDSLPDLSWMHPSMSYSEISARRLRNAAVFYTTLGQEDTPLPLKTNTP